MKTISRLLQFIIGFIVGISILGGVGFAAGYYFFTKMAATPPRPVFAEEQNKDKTSEGDSAGEEKEESKADVAATEEEEEQEEQEKQEDKEEEELEPGAYKAKVNWPEGLILRDKPGEDAEQLSGIAFDEEVIVLKESEDGRWQQVRIPNSDRQGWVKGGNVDKVE